ncbi:MAG: cob(I)yrinic acid a,c-diamide adenosyltransferase [Betaproteobacteria bacterium]|nr:cob(I)yrinic acid a,c-diamide adenosyltransferase [Betaproteobacteria bacterium]
MRITRVYTKTGDKGTTSLADGSRVSKTDMRLETYGTVDELNALVGLCRASLGEMPKLPASTRNSLDEWLERIQNDLFNLGGDLATPIASRWESMVVVGEPETTHLEQMIDLMQRDLPPLSEFVLPGGTRLNAELHQARTVCRRAERIAVQLQDQAEINPQAVPFLNRLSDFFFVASRWIQFAVGAPETTWKKSGGLRDLKLPPST